MRLLDSTSAAYLAARTGVASRHMVHVIARNRATGAAEALGLWQGDDHLTIAIGGTNRTYYGSGGLICRATNRMRFRINLDETRWWGCDGRRA